MSDGHSLFLYSALWLLGVIVVILAYLQCWKRKEDKTGGWLFGSRSSVFLTGCLSVVAPWLASYTRRVTIVRLLAPCTKLREQCHSTSIQWFTGRSYVFSTKQCFSITWCHMHAVSTVK